MKKSDSWSFGIIYGNNPCYIEDILRSIKIQNIENYEIILVGNSALLPQFTDDKIIIVDFDESIKPMWITKKKNIIARLAKYDNLSIHHDYVKLGFNWYKHFVDFRDDWDVCMNRIEQRNGSRFRDWIAWGNPISFVDYKDETKIKEMYVSGSYFCVKREFLLNNPLDENLCWGQGEDLEWSMRVRENWKYKCNWKSKVILCKDKDSYIRDDNDLSKKWYEKEQLL